MTPTRPNLALVWAAILRLEAIPVEAECSEAPVESPTEAPEPEARRAPGRRRLPRAGDPNHVRS
jgi:hypothetical protein